MYNKEKLKVIFMKWEKFTTMINLHNEGKEKEFYKFLENNLDELVDDVGLDAVINCVELTIENVKKNKDLFKKIVKKIEEKQINFESFSTAFRLEFLKQIIKEIEEKENEI